MEGWGVVAWGGVAGGGRWLEQGSLEGVIGGTGVAGRNR